MAVRLSMFFFAGLASFAADALEAETIANNAVVFQKWCGDLTSIGDAGWIVVF